jgi:hypothetical protein
MAYTNYARNKLQDFMFGGVTYSAPATYYLGLSTTTISVSGSNATEPSGAGYARVPITNDKTSWTYSSSGCLLNSTSLSFVESSGSWGTVTYVALWDAETSGSIWAYQALPESKIIQTGTTVSFSASKLCFTQS